MIGFKTDYLQIWRVLPTTVHIPTLQRRDALCMSQEAYEHNIPEIRVFGKRGLPSSVLIESTIAISDGASSLRVQQCPFFSYSISRALDHRDLAGRA